MDTIASAYENANPQSRTKNYDQAMGALLLGVNFLCVTYGILLGMAFIYYKRSEQDPRWLRFSVLCASLLCTFCVAISLHGTHWYTIMHYNDPSALQNTPWSVSLLPTFMSSVMLCVRLVFLSRVHKHYRDKLQNSSELAAITLVVVLLSFADLGFAAAVTGELFRSTNAGLTDTHTLRSISVGMFSVGIAADVLLTALLCISRLETRPGLLRENCITPMIIYIIRSGLIPCGCALATLICFLVSSRSLIYAPFYVQIGNLYLVSLLTTLNHRQSAARHIEQPLNLDYGPLTQCGATSLEQSPSNELDAYSLPSDGRGSTLSGIHRRMSIPKPLHVFRVDGRTQSVGGLEDGLCEKSQVCHRQSSDASITSSTVDMHTIS